MCDPLTIGVGVALLGAAQTVTEHIGTNAAYKANKQAANYSYARDTEAINRQDSQLQAEHSESAFDTAIAIAGESGRISASASESGLGSSSIASQLNAAMFGAGRQATAEDINFRNTRAEIASSRTDAELRRQAQINSKPRSGTLSLAIGLGQDAMSGFNAAQGAKKA